MTDNRYHFRLHALHLWLFFLVCIAIAPASGGEEASGSTLLESAPASGQTMYVPLYSHIFFGDTDAPFNLTGTLSIRNTDTRRAIRILSASYHDSTGKLVREYLSQPLALGPLASTYCIVPESDSAGGVGASFIVRWKSAEPANVPIIEAVMIGTRGQQGISFISRGQVLAE